MRLSIDYIVSGRNLAEVRDKATAEWRRIMGNENEELPALAEMKLRGNDFYSGLEITVLQQVLTSSPARGKTMDYRLKRLSSLCSLTITLCGWANSERKKKYYSGLITLSSTDKTHQEAKTSQPQP